MELLEYSCLKCGDEWSFIPEDFDFDEDYYPVICPLCNMPILEAVREVYQSGGLREVFSYIKNRYL